MNVRLHGRYASFRIKRDEGARLMRALGMSSTAPHPLLARFEKVDTAERAHCYDAAGAEITALTGLRERLRVERAEPTLLARVDAHLRETQAAAQRMYESDDFVRTYEDVKRCVERSVAVDERALETIKENIDPIYLNALNPEAPFIAPHVARLLALVGHIGGERTPVEIRKKLEKYRTIGYVQLGEHRYRTAVGAGLAAWYARHSDRFSETMDLFVGVEAKAKKLLLADTRCAETRGTPEADHAVAAFLDVAAKTETLYLERTATANKLIEECKENRKSFAGNRRIVAGIDAEIASLETARKNLHELIGRVQFQRYVYTLPQRADAATRSFFESPKAEAEARGCGSSETSAPRPVAAPKRPQRGCATVKPAAEKKNAEKSAPRPAVEPQDESRPETRVEQDVARLLNSDRRSQRLEGLVARHILDTDLIELLAVNAILRRGKQIRTEYDAESSDVIFEVTGARSGKLSQMERRTTREYNPQLKDQVLVAPEDFDAEEKAKIRCLRPEASEKSSMITLVTTIDGLDDVCLTLAKRSQRRKAIVG